jgi:hypothetical protein
MLRGDQLLDDEKSSAARGPDDDDAHRGLQSVLG